MSLFKSKSKWLGAFMLVIVWGCGSAENGSPPETGESPAEEAAEDAPPSGIPYATVNTRDGDIVIKLLPETAPRAVQNFIQLAKDGYYYNTTFHRVIPGAVIQGGDPNSKDNNPYNDGQGGSGRLLLAEFSDIPFKRGTVAMARRPGSPDTASTQFFICLKRESAWDGEYTVFGEVVEGIEVADKISKLPRSKDPQLKDRPTRNVEIKRIRIEYREE